MNLTIFYVPDMEGFWRAISLEYTYGSHHTQGDINVVIRFPANSKDRVKTKLKDWASENDRLLSAHLQEANITFIDVS